MPKPKKTKSSLVKVWIDNLDKNIQHHFQAKGSEIFCKPCGKPFQFQKYFQLVQHIDTATHKKHASLHQLQQPLDEAVPKRNEYFDDLCEAFLSADIPLFKLENPKLRAFLEKYTKKVTPDRSTLRKNYIPKLYDKTIEKIRQNVGNEPIWMAIDETTDALGRYMANVLIGPLKRDSTDSFLLNCKKLDKANNTTITQLALDSIKMLWPNHDQSEISAKFFLFLSDGAPYMIKAGKNLKGIYPSLIHVTCIVHGLNLVAEDVRSNFRQVDTMIGAVKAVFKKAPSRRVTFNEMFPNLELPPEPVLTRWGTWLDTVEYYSKYYEEIKEIIESFDPDDAECIKTAQEMMQNEEIAQQITYIALNFTFISKSIKELEKKGLKLSESLKIFQDVSQKLSQASGEKGKKAHLKLKKIIDKNPDLNTVIRICKVLEGEVDSTLDIEPSRLASFNYAPLTSVEVERSFSMLKSLLTDRRQSFTLENLEMSLVCHFELSKI